MSKSTCLLFWEIGKSEGCKFKSRSCIFDSWSRQTNAFQTDTCCFLAWRLSLGYNRARTGSLNVRIMQLNGIVGHGATGLVFQ